MRPLNRIDTAGRVNVIEHGWKFYKENTWTGGLFYWTGIDYRGEPNPMVWPATGSQFGILDYCGYGKDEAYYLRSWWVEDEPTIHICGFVPSTITEKEGKVTGEVWVYSNCPEVELLKGRRSLGRQKMPEDGHLVWKVTLTPSEAEDIKAGTFTARGTYRKGSSRLKVTDVWPYVPATTTVSLSKDSLRPDGQDVVVIDIDSPEESLVVSVSGAQFLGWGNGNPGFKEVERPVVKSCSDKASMTVRPFSGKCQVIVRSIEGSKEKATVQVGTKTVAIRYI